MAKKSQLDNTERSGEAIKACHISVIKKKRNLEIFLKW